MSPENQLQELIRKTTPLTEASFYILVSLAEPLHGYGVMQKVLELSRNRVQLGPGTLYGALTNLVTQGLIEAVDGAGGDRKKLYRLTENGKLVAEYEIQRMEELSRHGRMLLGI
jgi:DNA-binding PadR family transcriptional regulator